MKNMLSIMVLTLWIGLGMVSNHEAAFAGYYGVIPSKRIFPRTRSIRNLPILT